MGKSGRNSLGDAEADPEIKLGWGRGAGSTRDGSGEWTIPRKKMNFSPVMASFGEF